jgi:TctA family transporter
VPGRRWGAWPKRGRDWALALLVTLVLARTGPGGLLVTLAATGIGLIPVAFGCRKMNCVGANVAHWLGLI